MDHIATSFGAGLLANTCSTSSNCPLGVWSATATLNTPTVWGNADVPVRIQNDLTAESFIVGDSASIEKKQSIQSLAFTLFIEGKTTAVPVPGAVWLDTGWSNGFALQSRRVRPSFIASPQPNHTGNGMFG